jgi:hypothetical protein
MSSKAKTPLKIYHGQGQEPKKSSDPELGKSLGSSRSMKENLQEEWTYTPLTLSTVSGGKRKTMINALTFPENQANGEKLPRKTSSVSTLLAAKVLTAICTSSNTTTTSCTTSISNKAPSSKPSPSTLITFFPTSTSRFQYPRVTFSSSEEPTPTQPKGSPQTYTNSTFRATA